jgi:sugar-specific transcriptional regulator TrmB
MATDPDRELEHTTEEFDERLEKLEEHIEEAEKKAPDATLGEDGEAAARDD